jgi:hypothetical protein
MPYSSYLKSGLVLLVMAVLLMAAGAAAPQEGRLDGSMSLTCGKSTLLFRGAVPPRGFMVQVTGENLIVNDSGPAGSQPQQGFFLLNAATCGSTFITPPEYKPIGPVSVFCISNIGSAYIAARAW